MHKKNTYCILLFLVLISFLAFGRIADNDFINFDDTAYVSENIHIRSGINPASMKWAITTTYFSYWHPLTWLSHMLDWNLFGANASGHHIISLLLHIGAVIFLYLFLNKATGNAWISAFAAAFFAIHPLRTESVAWASERKDVLSMFFGMACLYVYAFYGQSPKLSKYFLCLILFALALMSKPTMVTLPFILLLLDYWPLSRWQNVWTAPAKSKLHSAAKLIGEKIPLFCLTIAVCMVTFRAQNIDGQVASMEHLPILNRVGNALIAYTVYLGKTLWPENLAIFYPYEHSLPAGKIIFSVMILLSMTSLAFYYMKKFPFLFVGWFVYLGALVPVIGFVQVGNQAVADRYTYLPSIGLALILSWGISSLFRHHARRNKILFPPAMAILIIMVFLTWRQCGYWKNSIEIFSHALSATKSNYLAHNSRGIAYGEAGQYQKAIDDFNRAIFLKPDYFRAYNNRGFAYTKLGQYQNAIRNYDEAIRLKPDYARAYSNRSLVYLIQGNRMAGCGDARKACQLGVCSTLKEAKVKGFCD